MSTSQENPSAGVESLKKRHAVQNSGSQVNAEDSTDRLDVVPDKEKKTFGRTPDGTGKMNQTPQHY